MVKRKKRRGVVKQKKGEGRVVEQKKDGRVVKQKKDGKVVKQKKVGEGGKTKKREGEGGKTKKGWEGGKTDVVDAADANKAMFPLQHLLQQRRTRLFTLLEQAVGSEDLRSQRHRVQLLFDAIADERAFFSFYYHPPFRCHPR